MRACAIAVVLSLALATAPSFAQTPAGQTPAGQTPPPTVQAPPAPAAPPQMAPQPPRPFPEGAKMAFVNIQRIANESSEGKASTSRVQALTQKKTAELGDKNKALAASQQKLQQSGAVLSDTARSQLEKEIEKMQVEIQRAQQDAQAEIQDLQQELQQEFQKRLLPVVQQVVTEKNLLILFSQTDAGIIWADGGLDLTAEVIKRFDAATVGSSAPPAALAPPAQAPPPAKPPAKPPVQ